MNPIYVYEIIEDLVSKVSTKLMPTLQAFDSLITGVHFDHGHPSEIIETLQQKDKSGTNLVFDKYPLVALFHDYPERFNQEVGIRGSVTLHMIIARSTEPTYKSSDRYDNNFKPVLYPIYGELMKQIIKSPYFMGAQSVNQLSHTKIDRLYWGREGLYKNEGNVFNDFIDCIEIRDLELKLNINNC
jgi:hypothetical protein